MDTSSSNDQIAIECARMQRVFGIIFGLSVHALFAITVWHLFWFLKGSEMPAGDRGGILLDCFLALLFAVPHSLLLLPAVRERLTRMLPECFTAACIVPSAVFVCCSCFRSGALVRSHCGRQPEWRWIIQTCFLGSWVALFYSLNLTGLGYQTGWTPWWHWLRRLPLPARKFQPRGAYLWLRHPVYLSFLGLIWLVPVMTLDRAILTGIWTIYIFCGSWLKDQRLIYYVGDRYRRYQAEVPGYPAMFIGPLSRSAMDYKRAIVPWNERDFEHPVSRKAT